MGYDTYFRIQVLTKDEAKKKACLDDIRKIADEVGNEIVDFDGEITFTARFYTEERDRDLKEVSEKHPDVIIEVYGDGEASDDMWCERWLGGRCEHNDLTTDPIYDFDEILTEEEHEGAFNAARTRLHLELRRYRKAARQRIARLKDRICGHEECFLDLSALNEDGRLCVVTPTDLITNECLPVAVGGFYHDAETFLAEDGEEHDLTDLEPDDVAKVVRMFEDLEKMIKDSYITGTWDEDEKTFRLGYAE